MEEFDYLEDMDNNNLIKIITDMIDFEETTRALMVLQDRDEKKAVEIGQEILKNNRGDDYLQATVWNILFYDNEIKMLEAVDAREEKIGKTLLDEIIIDLTNNKIITNREFLKKIRSMYLAISDVDKEYMRCNYNAFIEKYFD